MSVMLDNFGIREVLLISGALLPLVSGGIYVLSILRGKTKPQRMTNLLMTLITGLSFAALLAAHDTSGIWLALASFGQALIICTLSIRFGMGGRDRLDIICLIFCLFGVALWVITGESVVGLLAAVLADFIAVIPSLHKTVRLPHTETWVFYGLDTLAAALILLAGPYGWHDLLYPLYLFVINLIFVQAILVIPLYRRRKQRYNGSHEPDTSSD